MKIGIDARFYGILGKGLGRYTEQLILALERGESVSGTNEYYIFLRTENFDDYQPQRTNFHKVLADYQWYSFTEQFGFVQLLLRYHLDLMHFPHFNVPLFYWRPFVVTIHDLILLQYPTQKASTRHFLFYWGKFLVYRMVIASALRRARAIIAVSKFTRDDLRRQYHFLRHRPIVVTYQAATNFCRWQSPVHSRQMIREILLRADKTLVGDSPENMAVPEFLLYVGNAYPHKNLERLARVFGSLASTGKRLVFVGRPDYFYRRLRRMVDREQITNCFFVGGVNDEELPLLYRFARGYIFPSLYEGAGLPPLEAMTYGLPVAVTERTSLPEMVGEAALFFNPKNERSIRDVIERLWMDEALRDTLREAGFQQIRKFSWDTLAQQTRKVYKKAVCYTKGKSVS
ncbi:MAG: glycosyltransferase family 1 protein [Candidatus Moraniibacteriota bacterium]